MDEKKIAKKSRSGAVLTLIGFVMMTIVFGYLFYDVHSKNQELKEYVASLEKEREESNFVAAKLKKDLVEATRIKDSLVITGNGDWWEQTSSINTLEAYETYVRRWPEKKPEVYDVLKKRLFNEKGYVQIIETNGNKLFGKMSTEFDGEFLSAKVARSVRNGIIGNSDYKDTSRNGDVILEGQPVLVLNRIQSKYSKSVWAEIAYSN